jgi:D-alanine--poly(phosphoribitol) ligase subunit 1
VSLLRYYANAAAIFADVARERRDAIAIRWTRDAHTTYARLDAVSNQIARILLDRGVRKRDTVCLAGDKCLATYGAMLACLKIGAPYFAVDPGNPRSRLQSMVDRCRPVLALVGSSVDPATFRCDTLLVEEGASELPWLAGVDDREVDVPWTIAGSDPAYVMFTSGSTGAPKGATISQNNLVNFIHWAQYQFDIDADDVLTNLNPLFFDNSVFDIYASLFTGASLVPFTAATLRDPHAVLARVDELGCTMYFSVPSLLIYFQRLKLVGPASFPSLKKIVFGGEGYPKPMLAKMYKAVGHRIQLHNVYGPTECTCICSVYRISDLDFTDLKGYPPLGRLIPNFSYVILDEASRAVAPGETGELCLGGPCVGLGYYGAPEQTAAVFVQNPTHGRFFDRLYKTGDLVKYDPVDQKIHFVGRADTQIKHQGYRIELGEIEHALLTIDGVDEAAAIHMSASGTSRILAVVASTDSLAASAVRAILGDALPKYMIPERIIVARQLPKNANGKIDRKGIAAAIAQGEL